MKKSCLVFLLMFGALLIIFAAVIVRSSPLNPISSVFHTIGYTLTDRLHFPSDRIDQVVSDDAGRTFAVFREVVVDPLPSQPQKPGAVLVLHFQVDNLSPQANQLYSLLPLPFYLGDPGFRSKLFTINGEYCQSIYEWDTVQDAQDYVDSFALKTIYARSIPGSVTVQIIPATE